MADQRSDDIRGLFAHLGLDPGAYQELRSPTKDGQAPGGQRWSVTPAGAPPKAAAAEPRPPAEAPKPAPAAAPSEPVPPAGRPGETAAQPPVAPVVSARQTLESFFESVKRSPPTVAPTSPPTLQSGDRPTDKLLRELQRLAQESSRRISKLTDDASQRVAEGGGTSPRAPTPPAATPRVSLTGMEAPQGLPVDLKSRLKRLEDDERAAAAPPAGSAPRPETQPTGSLQDIFRRLENTDRNRN